MTTQLQRASLFLCFTCLLACNRLPGCGKPPLAELRKAQGNVTRDEREHENQWSTAEVGARFSWGDGLRTAPDATAQLSVGRTGRVLVDSDTIIRFLSKPAVSEQAPAGFEVAAGHATIESEADPLTIATRGGRAVLQPGTRLDVRPAAQGDSYRVVMGGATFTQDNGEVTKLAPGQSLAVGIGLAVFDEGATGAAKQRAAQPDASQDTVAVLAPDAGPGVLDASSPDTSHEMPPQPSAADAQPSLASDLDPRRNPKPAPEPSIDRPAELIVPIGESFRVYDPRPPTLIGFDFAERCPAGAELLVDHSPVRRGNARVVAELSVGSHSYKARCSETRRGSAKILAQGTFQVLRSDGARALARTAPRNAIELDGHKYRLMYQSLRPIVIATWTQPPAAASEYTLTIEAPTGRSKTFKSNKPSYEIASEALGDGKHLLFMTADDTAKTRSKPTTVDIAFDNAAPAASIELPRAGGFSAQEPLEIRGVAVAGSRISVDGAAIELARDQRFSHTVAQRPGQTAVAIRIQHPAYGVRYYLRRVLSAQR